jgi:hypothetical protein
MCQIQVLLEHVQKSKRVFKRRKERTATSNRIATEFCTTPLQTEPLLIISRNGHFRVPAKRTCDHPAELLRSRDRREKKHSVGLDLILECIRRLSRHLTLDLVFFGERRRAEKTLVFVWCVLENTFSKR